MKDKGSNNRSAAAKKSKKRLLQRQRPAKDKFGEQLLKRKGSIDPKTDLEF